MSNWCIYQARTCDGDLLYVGYSNHWPNRWASHAATKSWWKQITELKVTWFEHQADALWYEAFLINTHRPPHNKKIPEIPIPSRRLDTICSLCPTRYHVSMRLPGSRCEDLSLKALPNLTRMTERELIDAGCYGRCELEQETPDLEARIRKATGTPRVLRS